MRLGETVCVAPLSSLYQNEFRAVTYLGQYSCFQVPLPVVILIQRSVDWIDCVADPIKPK